MEEKRFFIPCDCGCNIMEFDYFDEEEMFISNYVSTFYEKQDQIFGNILRRIKFIWFILRGKEFHLYEVVIRKEQLQEFKKWVAEL